jgi:hypothetical protein
MSMSGPPLILQAAPVPEVELLGELEVVMRLQRTAVLRVLGAVPAVGLPPFLLAAFVSGIELP